MRDFTRAAGCTVLDPASSPALHLHSYSKRQTSVVIQPARLSRPDCPRQVRQATSVSYLAVSVGSLHTAANRQQDMEGEPHFR